MHIQLSKNPIKRKRAQKKERQKITRLVSEGRLVDGVEIPPNVLAANPSEQAYCGFFAIKYYYRDIEYQCNGCGKHGTWTATQQKRYFEDQKGNLFNAPKWCYRCHRKRMAAKYGSK